MRRKYKQIQELGDEYKIKKIQNPEKKRDSLLKKLLISGNTENKQNPYFLKINNSFIQKNKNDNSHELSSSSYLQQNLKPFKKKEIPIENRKKIIKSMSNFNRPIENKIQNVSKTKKTSSPQYSNENYCRSFNYSQNSPLMSLRPELDDKKNLTNSINKKIVVNKYSTKNINNSKNKYFVNRFSYPLNSNDSKSKQKISVSMKNNLNNNNPGINNEGNKKNNLSIIAEKISFLNNNEECESLSKQKKYTEFNNNNENSNNYNNILNKQENNNQTNNKSLSIDNHKKKNSDRKNKINSHVVKQKKYYNIIIDNENNINNNYINTSMSKVNYGNAYKVKFNPKYNPIEENNEIKFNTRNIIIKSGNSSFNNDRKRYLIDKRIDTSLSENNYSYDSDLCLINKQYLIRNKKFFGNNYNYYIHSNPELKKSAENEILYSNNNNIYNAENIKKNTPKNNYINNVKNNNNNKIEINNSPTSNIINYLSSAYKSKTTKNFTDANKILEYESNNNENQKGYYSSLLENSSKKRNKDNSINQKYLDIKKMIIKEENLRNKDINLSMSENSDKGGVYKNSILSLYKRNPTLPLKSFKFLVHEAIGDKNIKDSFCKYYNLKKDDSNALSMSYDRDFNTSLGSIPNSNNIMKNGSSYENFENGRNKKIYNTNCIYGIENISELEEMKNHKPNVVSLYKKATGIEKNDLNKSKSHLNNSNNYSENLTITNILNSKDETINDNIENSQNVNNLIETSPIIVNIGDDIDEAKDINKNIEKSTLNKIINNNTYNTTLNFFHESTSSNNNPNIEILTKLLPHKNNIGVINGSPNRIYNNNNNNANLTVSPLSQISSQKVCDIEILYNLENKILLIINKIDEYKICKNECYDYINFYFSSNIYEYIIKLFCNNHNKNNIINYIKLELLCYFLCYDLSFNKYFNQAALLIKSIINIIHDNFLLLIKFIISEYFSVNSSMISERSNGYVNELNKIIEEKLTIRIDDKSINEFSIIQIITDNTKNINNYYIMILENLYKNKKEDIIKNKNLYRFPNCIEKYNEILEIANKNLNDINISQLVTMFFFDSYRLLNNYNIVDLKKFFDLYLDRQPASVSISIFSDEKEKKNINIFNKYKKEKSLLNLLKLPSPIMKSNKYPIKNKSVVLHNNFKNYLTEVGYLPDIDKTKYKYTLVIELNEILVYLNKDNNGIEDVVLYRQGLLNFLSEMKKIYEIIIFSYENSDLVESTVKEIQKDEKYFEYVLDRQYGIEENGIFYKDLNLLNRDEKYIVIVDVDTKYYYEDWKKNCICIKPFLGDIKNDKILSSLCQLLRNIKYDAEFSDDIRLSINKYKKAFVYSKISK